MAGSNIKLMENYIDYLSERTKAINKNIANIGTERYKREDVKFVNVLDNEMKNNLKVSNPKHLTSADNTSQSYKLEVDRNDSMVSGLNNIDIDEEMMNLAENTIRFKFTSRKISNHFKTLQKIITGGGRG
jgi:flagellar basal-body rod protein FlgB